MKLNSFRLIPSGYEAPSLDEQRTHGPGELAELIKHFREWTVGSGFFGQSPLSSQGLKNLLEFAFYASMMTEEGKFHRFNLVNRDFSFQAAAFPPVWLETPDSMRRLAPACSHKDCALRVFEENGKLWCNGLDVILPKVDVPPGAASPPNGGTGPSLYVRVKGPGHLHVHEIGIGYELRGGTIRHLAPFTMLEPVRKMLTEITDNLKGEFAQKLGEQLREAGNHNFTVRWVIETAVRFAVEARRGGAFVFLPDKAADAASFDVHPKYSTTSPDLGSDVVNFWEKCFPFWKTSCLASELAKPNKYNLAIQNWLFSRTRMLTHADVVGNLSCVDGCVVLNRRLQVCGFGAEIRITDERLKNSPRAFKNFKTGEVWPDAEFLGGIGGTRHKSAARLCKAHPGVVVVVVSQDGDIRVFSSNADSVYGFDSLDTLFE